jgi:hypothetical protein
MGRRLLQWSAASAVTVLSVGLKVGPTTAAATVALNPSHGVSRLAEHEPLPAVAVPRPPAVVGHGIRLRTGGVVARTPGRGASADALRVGPADLDTCFSCTTASAGGGDQRAESTAIRVLGTPIVGGSSAGTGRDQGQLLALPANPVLGLLVAPWSTSADSSGDVSTAEARSALLDADVTPDSQQPVQAPRVRAALLETTSVASSDGMSSRSQSSHDGLHASLGDESLTVLHSEAASTGPAEGYICDVPGAGRIGRWVDGGLDVAGIGRVGRTLVEMSGSSGVDGSSANLSPLPPRTAGASPSAPTFGVGALAIPNTGAALGAGAFVLILAGITVLASILRRRSVV